MPMKFHATRYWGSREDRVPLAYALDIQPIPHQPWALLGDLYHLTFTLVDLQGRAATEEPVSIGILRNGGNLELIQAEAIPRHHPIKEFHEGIPGGGSWYSATWKSLYHAYRQGMSISKACEDGHEHGHEYSASSHCHDHSTLDDWTDRNFLKHLRPVLLPGLFGLGTGIVTFALGFLLGKLGVAFYYLVRERAYTSNLENGVEAAVSEKRLMAV